jgi:hypothetical protein
VQKTSLTLSLDTQLIHHVLVNKDFSAF